MEKQAWSTKADAINQAILPALGEFAADYDIDAIADELASAFWEIATDHDLKA